LKWFKHKNLSEEDLELLRGTSTIEKLMATRLVVHREDSEQMPTMKELGLFNTTGLYFVRGLQPDSSFDNTMEILFELESDRDMAEQHLTQFKLGQD